MKIEDVSKGAWIKLPNGDRGTKLGKTGNKVNVILTTGFRIVIMIGTEVEVC